MNNNKMTRTAKNLDIFANVGGKMFTEGAITLDLDFIKFHLNDNSYVNEKLEDLLKLKYLVT